MMVDEKRIPDLMLEQYALGELFGDERARLEERLAADPSLRDRLDALRRSDEEILAELPPAEIAASIRRRMLVAEAPSGAAASAGARRQARGRLNYYRAFAFPAAAAVLVMAGAVMVKGFFLPARGDVVLAKGGAPGLIVYKKDASGPAPLSNGAQAKAGDLLQIKYAAGSARFGTIVSLDGRGRITWHLPSEYAGFREYADAAESGASGPAGGSAALAPRLETAGAALGSAYELDDAPSFERFFILSSNEDFYLSVVSKALGELSRGGSPQTADPVLPSGIECKSLLLLKAAAR
jgi:hypothetical protein